MVSPQQRAVIVGGGIMAADITEIFAAGGHAVEVVQRPGPRLARRKQLA